MRIIGLLVLATLGNLTTGIQIQTTQLTDVDENVVGSSEIEAEQANSSEPLNDFLLHQHMKGTNSIHLRQFRLEHQRNFMLKMNQTNFSSTPNVFALTHHKSGTVLAKRLMEKAAFLNRVPFFHKDRGLHGCQPGKTGIYQNIDKDTIQNLNHGCPNFRAFHVIREAMALTASGYMYHKWNRQDRIKGTGPVELAQAGSLGKALQLEARAEIGTTLKEMMEAHDLLKNDPRVLTVHYEDFQENFDNTVHRVFTHLYGSDWAKLKDMQRLATSQDVSRWSPVTKARNNHIAGDRERQGVMDTLQALLDSGDATISQVKAFDAKLGYWGK